MYVTNNETTHKEGNTRFPAPCLSFKRYTYSGGSIDSGGGGNKPSAPACQYSLSNLPAILIFFFSFCFTTEGNSFKDRHAREKFLHFVFTFCIHILYSYHIHKHQIAKTGLYSPSLSNHGCCSTLRVHLCKASLSWNVNEVICQGYPNPIHLQKKKQICSI